MPELSFEVATAEIVRDAATATIAFPLRITNQPPEEAIHSILLRCQLQIESPRRRYSATEKEQLRDLFGEPERWGQTLRPMLWTNISLIVPAFSGSISVPVHVPCTFDLNIAVSKYFHGLEEGDVPLTFLFSGTVFYEAAGRGFQVAPVSWNSEARSRFTVRLWKEMMDRFYANVSWLCLRKEIIEELYRFKVREGLATLDDAVQRMLVLAAQQQDLV